MIFLRILLLVLLFFQLSCETTRNVESHYKAEIDAWAANRVERLKRPNSWLNLVGLYWFEKGENTFGSDPGNDIVFPEKAEPVMGTFTLKEGVVTLQVAPGVIVLCDSVPTRYMVLKNDNQENTTIMEYKSLRWYIIKRDDMIGVRLRDLEHPLLTTFQGIDRFPVSHDWQIKAKFEPLHPPKVISIPNVLGQVREDSCYGAYVFEKAGNTYKLYPSGDPAGERMSVIFGDATNGKTTYGGGRFVTLPTPDSTGHATLDFNKAYNPPCVFSPYATCPLPAEINKISLAIEAGEKMWGKTH